MMPVSINTWRAHTGGFHHKGVHRFVFRQGFSNEVFTALLVPAPPLGFLLLYFTILSTLVYPFKSEKMNLGVGRLPLMVVWWDIVPLWYLLILAGDVEVNPGYSVVHLNGRLSFGFWNLNSLLAREGCKISQIEAMQSCNSFDLFGCCETWLNDKTADNATKVDGFFEVPFRADSPLANTHPRGGVCLFYKENVPITQRKDLQLIPECIVAQITLKNNAKMFFVLAYRSPSQSSEELKDFMAKLALMTETMNKEKPCLIAYTGDFNARSPILWDGEATENSAGKQMVDFCISNDYEQIVDEPTHLPDDGTDTCIDLILTNKSSAFVDCGVLRSPDPACKHQIVKGKINLHVPPPPKYKRKIWEYGKGNQREFRNELGSINWANIFLGKTVNQMAETFTSMFLEIAQKHVPSKIITVCDKDAPWITDEVKTAIRRNKRVYRKWVKKGRIKEEKNKINIIQNETNSIISKAKRAYTDNLGKKLCDPNCGQKVFWSFYKRLLNNKKEHKYPTHI